MAQFPPQKAEAHADVRCEVFKGSVPKQRMCFVGRLGALLRQAPKAMGGAGEIKLFIVVPHTHTLAALVATPHTPPSAAMSAPAPTPLRFGPACLCCLPPTAWWDPEQAALASKEGPRREAPKLLNTFTKTKVPFVPLDGNRVGWYICGPTVYGRGGRRPVCSALHAFYARACTHSPPLVAQRSLLRGHFSFP